MQLQHIASEKEDTAIDQDNYPDPEIDADSDADTHTSVGSSSKKNRKSDHSSFGASRRRKPGPDTITEEEEDVGKPSPLSCRKPATFGRNGTRVGMENPRRNLLIVFQGNSWIQP